MVTRNFYPVQAVAAMLLHSLSAGDRETAIAAAKELVASDEHECLQTVLTLAWLLAPVESECEKFRYTAFLAKDSAALLSALLAESFRIPELPTLCSVPPPEYELADVSDAPVPRGWTPGSAAVLMRAVRVAYRAGNGRRVYRLLAPHIEYDTAVVLAFLRILSVPESLIELLEDTVFAPLIYRVLMHTTTAHPPVYILKRGFSVSKYGREARTFTVSAEVLGAWGVRATPVTQLLGKPLVVSQIPTTRYWSALLQKHGADTTLNFPTDDACESFYAEGFPDDIPDEWSAEERAKSHGILPAGEKSPWAPAFALCFT